MLLARFFFVRGLFFPARFFFGFLRGCFGVLRLFLFLLTRFFFGFAARLFFRTLLRSLFATTRCGDRLVSYAANVTFQNPARPAGQRFDADGLAILADDFAGNALAVLEIDGFRRNGNGHTQDDR